MPGRKSLNAGAGAVYDFGKKIKARFLRVPERIVQSTRRNRIVRVQPHAVTSRMDGLPSVFENMETNSIKKPDGSNGEDIKAE